VLKISISPYVFHKIRVPRLLAANCAFFDQNILTKKLSDNFPTAKKLKTGNCTLPRHDVTVTADIINIGL